MKVLIIGGTGLIGDATVVSLLRRGHTVRLVSRHADNDIRKWPQGVEAHKGDVSDPRTLSGAALGCDAVIHVAGIVAERPPEVTFEKVNVEGTQHVIEECQRSGAVRLIFISSLGADRGRSPYHQSKMKAEDLVRASGLDWTVVRPGNVYGPGDAVISALLKMVRTLPIIPVIDDGNQKFQPIWCEDLGEGLAVVAERSDLSHETLELAGDDLTSMNDLLEHFSRITERSPFTLSLPTAVASIATRFASATGVTMPIDDSQLTMLREENYIRGSSENSLVTRLAITPTPLAEGLARLADAAPEQLPAEGIDGLKVKRFWADIAGSEMSAAQIFNLFRSRCNDIMPLEFNAENRLQPGLLCEGDTLTAELPFRGNIQMRVVEVDELTLTFSTLQGHPLAGIVRFAVEQMSTGLRFAVETYSRSADLFDAIAMKTVGGVLQDRNWKAVVTRVVELSGGQAGSGVQQHSASLRGDEAERVESWIETMIIDRQRDVNIAAISA
ncbi:MAG TPA: DUF1990 family protein [Thermoanaerobaculia bacterium]|nr:DUF1990 family protein [Thermoanaerobaculia bacterium]